MRTKLRSKVTLLFMTLGLVLALPAIALADQIVGDADNDALATPHPNNRNFTLAPGDTATFPFDVFIKETGNATDDVFKTAGDFVSVKIERSGDWLDTSDSGSPASFNFTQYTEDDTSTSTPDNTQSGTIKVKVPCEATGSKIMSAKFTGTAMNDGPDDIKGTADDVTLPADRQLSGSLTLTHTITASGTKNPSCPTAEAGGPYEGNEGTNIALSGSGTDTNGTTPGIASYAWDLDNNGSFETSGQNVNFSAPQVTADTNYTVKLQVTDNDGQTATDTATVTVRNVVNTAPVVNKDNATVTVAEGATATNTGTWSDAASDTVDLSASVGDVVKNADGTWSWSYATTDGPDNSQNVTITATDNHGASNSTTFALTVNNVAPTVAFTAGPTSVNEGSTQHTYNYSISDPGQDTVQSVTTSCGTGGVKVLDSDTNTNTSGSFKCTFADGPLTPSPDVTVKATDSDGAAGNTATRSVSVANVAPTTTLSTSNPGVGTGSVDEGSTQRTYSYSVSDPGQDTVKSVATSCGLNGVKVLDSDSFDNTTNSGSFKCTFDDGTKQSEVSAEATDSDDAVGNKATQTVNIANVAPTGTLGNNGPKDEGSAASVSFTGVSDASSVDAASLRYAFDCSGGSLAGVNYASASTSTSTNCTFYDNGSFNVSGVIIDKDGGRHPASTSVTVANVDPTASNGTFVFNPVLGTATAGFSFSDVGTLDTHVQSYFTWSGLTPANQLATVVESNGSGTASNTRTLSPGCYNLAVTGTAVDDDGGDSDALSIYSNTQTSVYSNAFRPPIQDNERNIAKFGNVVPVKVQLTNPCTGTTVTNQSLYITVAKGVGNEAIEDTNVVAESVSSADSGQQMRVADGGYIYNLSTKSLSQNTDWTVRVRVGSTTGDVILQAVLYPKK